MAWHQKITGGTEYGMHLAHVTRYYHAINIGAGDENAVDHVRAGEAQRHRLTLRDDDAARHEGELRRHNACDHPVIFNVRAEIAFGELACEVKRLWVDTLQITGWITMQGEGGKQRRAEHKHDEDANNGASPQLGADDRLFTYRHCSADRAAWDIN